MQLFKLSDVEYNDGCYSGIVTIFNKDNGNYEYFTFLYDFEMDSLDLSQRTLPDFKASFVSNLSDYMLINYYYIVNEIKFELKMRNRGYY